MDLPTEKYDEAESDVVQPAIGWWWTATDESDGASGHLSLNGVTRLQLGMDVARVNTAVGSRCGLEYEPLRVFFSSRLSLVSVLVCVPCRCPSIMTTMVKEKRTYGTRAGCTLT